MKFHPGKKEGQSILIVAVGLVALVALMGLVVDAGNAYVQRRKIQNAVDAGSEAGSLAMGMNKNEGQVLSAIQTFAGSNGVSNSDLHTYYVVQAANGNYLITTYTLPYCGNGCSVPTTLSWGGSNLPVVGVNVQANNVQFPTYFGGVIGWRTMQASAGSSRTVNKGACSGDTLFPIAVAEASFGGFGVTPSASYRLYENNPGNPNKFGFLTWNGSTGVGTLVSNMQQYASNVSGTWAVNDNISNAVDSSSVSLSNSSISSALQTYITSGAGLTVPVYDTYASSKYHVKGFARIKVTGYSGASGNKYIDVQFQYFDTAKGAGGCAYFITSAPGVPGQTPTVRTVVGQVKLQKLTPKNGPPSTGHVPVDVVNVLDISGSMTGAFGSTNKLQGAKQALTNFNSNMQPSLGDQAGLVTFPLIQNGSSYSYSCTQNGNYSSYYFGQVRSTLTTNITGTNGVNSIINGLSANGGTPLADGIRLGRQTVLGTNHQSDHPAVMIVASDGIANIRTNGRWTGDSGTTYENNTCNQPSVQDAIDQANVAKSDANGDGSPDVIIFAIAVGNDFNPASLRAIASTDTDPSKPHFFQVTDASSMASIYQQIANRVQNFSGEGCQLIATEATAGGATVAFQNLTTGTNYNLTTNSAGEFILPSAPAGTYQFNSASVTIAGITYNVFTDGPGGPVMGSNPTLPVATGSGTYSIDLALKTTQTVNCP